VETRSTVGGGSLPGQTQPSWAAAYRDAEQLGARLRQASPPVIGRIEDDRLLLDLRTVLPEQDAVLEQVLHEARGT
jgi:L-seryl-tRNA(Ser) seleniumtransferase